MLGPPPQRPTPAGHGGTSIMPPAETRSDVGPQDLRQMIQSVLTEVGVAPKTLPGKSGAPSMQAGEPISRSDVKQMIMELLETQQSGPSLLHDQGEPDISGARGAVAYSREKSRFEANPENAYTSFRNQARRMLGKTGSAPTTFKNLMTELPFGTMNNRKRVALVLLTVLDEMEDANYAAAKGLLSQAMRWIVLDLENPRDALTSWRLTFLPDPVPMVTPVRSPGGLDLNNSLLDAGQLTATLGMSRDMELLTKRLKGVKDDAESPPPNRPKAKKGGGKGEGE